MNHVRVQFLFFQDRPARSTYLHCLANYARAPLPKRDNLSKLESADQVSPAPYVSLGGGIPRELDKFLTFLGGVRMGGLLKSFKCGSNRWVEPPAAVLGERGNIPAVRSYFVDLYREKRVMSRSLKVVLVGKEGTGKTR